MGQGCRESQRSYLGRSVIKPKGNPDWEVRLRWQKSAEVIVPPPIRWEGPNIKEAEYFEQIAG